MNQNGTPFIFSFPNPGQPPTVRQLTLSTRFLQRLFPELNGNTPNIIRQSMEDTGGIKRVATVEFLESLKTLPECDPKEDETECPICMDEFDTNKGIRLECGHLFHRECITEWFEGYYQCPTCRHEYPYKECSRRETEQSTEEPSNEETSNEETSNEEISNEETSNEEPLPMGIDEGTFDEFFRRYGSIFEHIVNPPTQSSEDTQGDTAEDTAEDTTPYTMSFSIMIQGDPQDDSSDDLHDDQLQQAIYNSMMTSHDISDSTNASY